MLSWIGVCLDLVCSVGCCFSCLMWCGRMVVVCMWGVLLLRLICRWVVLLMLRGVFMLVLILLWWLMVWCCCCVDRLCWLCWIVCIFGVCSGAWLSSGIGCG